MFWFLQPFLPVTYLGKVEEYRDDKNWKSKPIKGSVRVVYDNGKIMKSQ